jgi:hypothetical protein
MADTASPQLLRWLRWLAVSDPRAAVAADLLRAANRAHRAADANQREVQRLQDLLASVMAGRSKAQAKAARLENTVQDLRGQLQAQAVQHQRRLRDLRARLGGARPQATPGVPAQAPRRRQVLPGGSSRKAPAVVQEVAALLDCTTAMVCGRRRTARIVRVRSVVAWALRNWLDLSYPEIGTVLHRDHSTVIHAVRAADDMLWNDPELRADLDALRDSLGLGRVANPGPGAT